MTRLISFSGCAWRSRIVLTTCMSLPPSTNLSAVPREPWGRTGPEDRRGKMSTPRCSWQQLVRGSLVGTESPPSSRLMPDRTGGSVDGLLLFRWSPRCRSRESRKESLFCSFLQVFLGYCIGLGATRERILPELYSWSLSQRQPIWGVVNPDGAERHRKG